MTKPRTFTEDNFQTETAAGVSLIDFYADWCPPCKALSPTVDQLAKKHGNSVTIGKVNVDDAKDLAQAFNVRSIPTIVALKDGKEVSRVSGNVPLNELETLITQAEAS